MNTELESLREMFEEDSDEEEFRGFSASAVAGPNSEQSELATDNGELTEEEEGAGTTAPSPQSSSFSLSPMPLLEFTNGMNELINTALKMTPARHTVNGPAPQPPQDKRPAPQPPSLKTPEIAPAVPQKSVAWVLSPPPIPPRPRQKTRASQLSSWKTRASQLDNTFNR